MPDEDFAQIKAQAFVVTLNYAPIRLRGHLNLWSDRRVSQFLEQYYASRPKDCLFLVQENRTSRAFRPKVDFWFDRKKENLQGNYTIVWALQLLRKYFPEKKILLFGVDLYASDTEQAKWYDRFTDYDRKKRGTQYQLHQKLNQCGEQIALYVPPQNIYNCNPRSHLQHFEKKNWREVLGLNILHLCPSALAGAPVHLSQILNKYTACISKTVLKKEFTASGLANLRWKYDMVDPSDIQIRELVDWADIIHYHRLVYPRPFKHKPCILQFHSPQMGYRPGRSHSWLNNRKLAVAQYQPLIYTDALIVPNLIDIWESTYQPEQKPDDRIKIFYSWASEQRGGWRDKGSNQTIKILNQLQHRYGQRVEICILNNAPYEACMQAKRTAHICIDECVTGSYHLQSLEGCSVGALTLNNLNKPIAGFIRQVTGQDTHPFHTTNLDQLLDTLCHFIESPKEIYQLGNTARKWMEAHWDPRKMITQYTNAYFNALNTNTVFSYSDSKTTKQSQVPPILPPLSVTNSTKPKTTNVPRRPFQKSLPVGKPISELHQIHKGRDIYIFGTGPSLFHANPSFFKDKICFGINYAFEVMPHIDYHFVHVIETYEVIRKIVDNQKLVLPETLVRQYHYKAKQQVQPHRIDTCNPDSWIYPIQNPYEKNIQNKHLDLEPDARIFTWSTTTHSAIHLAAYMGAKCIYLIGVDYELYPGGKVHFDSRHCPDYGQQDWNANAKHRQGDRWLAQKLKPAGISLVNLSRETTRQNLADNPLSPTNLKKTSPSVAGQEFLSKSPTAGLLSICLTVHNRSRFHLPNGQYAPLFPNCLHSIEEAVRHRDDVEIVISDYHSTDWPLEEWVPQVLKSIPHQIVNVSERFHSGRGRNIAADHARGEFLFFLDAEMLITPAIVDRGLEHLRANRAYYPICFYFLNPEHSLGFWCEGGKGNCFLKRSWYTMAGKWPCPPSYKQSYNVDQVFFRKMKATGVPIVNERASSYFHQYHPGRSVDIAFKRRHHLMRKVTGGVVQEKRAKEPVITGKTHRIDGGSSNVRKPESTKEDHLPITRISACLLSYKRPQNMQRIVDSLHCFNFIDEILVWNNNPAEQLALKGSKVQVINSPKNQLCYGRFECARRAKNEIIYVQDDDALVQNIPQLLAAFLQKESGITYGLLPKHYRDRKRYEHFYGQVALLGWGAFFRKPDLAVLDSYLAHCPADFLFRREADQIFSIRLGVPHHPMRASVQLLDHHSTKGVALYREENHYLWKAQAVRRALAFNRMTISRSLPVSWNVVIPCRNYGKYLEEAVRSVLQNEADYVITIVDDNSTDNTGNIGKTLAEEYDFINYLQLDRPHGVSYARNYGIAFVDSLFVVLLDADDKIGARYLSDAEKLLRNGCDVANPDAILFGNQTARWEVPPSVHLQDLLSQNRVHTCAAFRRSYWVEVGGIDEQMANWQDYEFWLRLAAAGARIKKLPGDHFYYRKHGVSKSTESRKHRQQLLNYIHSKHKHLFLNRTKKGRNASSAS